MRPERIDTIEDVKTWIADHDGRIDAYWDAQHALNERTTDTLEALTHRLGALEKKVVMFAGIAAGAGGLLGTFIRSFLESP